MIIQNKKRIINFGSSQEEALQKFNKLFDNSPVPMAISILPDRKFIDVNNAFTHSSGYSADEVIGKTASELNLFTEQDKQQFIAEQLSEKGRIANIELTMRKQLCLPEQWQEFSLQRTI